MITLQQDFCSNLNFLILAFAQMESSKIFKNTLVLNEQFVRSLKEKMVRDCYYAKAGAFCAAAVNLSVGGLSLGAAIYKVVLNKGIRVGLLVILFMLSALLIYNGILLIVGIVMVNREYVALFLVLNCVNWLVISVLILKEVSTLELVVWLYIGLSALIGLAWFFEIVVYLFYRNMYDRHIDCESKFVEVIDNIVSIS